MENENLEKEEVFEMSQNVTEETEIKFELNEGVAKLLGIEYDENVDYNEISAMNVVEFQRYFEKIQAHENEANNKYLYKMAEYENSKKRLIESRDAAIKYKYEPLFKDLLDTIDNFERALSTFVIKDETNQANYNGIKLIYVSLINRLKSNGLTKLEVNEGDQFNVDFMNAVTTINIPDKINNEVVSIIKNGYIYNDKIIRYADVVVNQTTNE